jgi:hypothetical protein
LTFELTIGRRNDHRQPIAQSSSMAGTKKSSVSLQDFPDVLRCIRQQFGLFLVGVVFSIKGESACSVSWPTVIPLPTCKMKNISDSLTSGLVIWAMPALWQHSRGDGFPPRAAPIH